MEENEFKTDLEIDIESLETEAVVQPELYFKWAKLAVETKENADRAKMFLDVVYSELAKKVRTSPADFGLKKITEGTVTETVKSHPEYQSALENMIQAKAESEIHYKAQEAMEQRKRMLELLVQLHSREYFAGPSIPHTPDEFWKEIKKKKGEKTKKKMVRRAKKHKRKKDE